MIRVTVELLSGGSEKGKKTLDSLTIVNDRTGDEEEGRYYTFLSSKPSVLSAFSHSRKGSPWFLVLAALRALLER